MQNLSWIRPVPCTTMQRRESKVCCQSTHGSTIGECFRVHTFGESHGKGVGAVIDGCPPRIPLRLEHFERDMARRRPGQSAVTTSRAEPDAVEILSGVQDGLTLGTPIALFVPNRDTRSSDYAAVRNAYRPSHADFTYEAKYGVWAPGGGRASARETAARVAAGVVAKRVLSDMLPRERSLASTSTSRTEAAAGAVPRETFSIAAFVSRVGSVYLQSPEAWTSCDVTEIENDVRCPCEHTADLMRQEIVQARRSGDSLGGSVDCVIRGAPVGLGDPVFNKLSAALGAACLSVPAAKAFEIGSGVEGSFLKGSEHNDAFYVSEEGHVRTRTNRSGGLQGGLSTGEPIVFRVSFKPTSTISSDQKSVSRGKEEVSLRVGGRHDPCVVPRAVPIIEAMAAIVLCDHYLLSLPYRYSHLLAEFLQPAGTELS
eukprot:Rmarinus@m.23669